MTISEGKVTICFHEDVFYEYFRPFRHPEAKFNIWGGHGLETFGEDLRLVREYPQQHVWTVVDGDEDQWIFPGLSFVNRVCYLLSELPHNEAALAFRVARSGRSLSPIGFARRIAVLRSLMTQTL